MLTEPPAESSRWTSASRNLGSASTPCAPEAEGKLPPFSSGHRLKGWHWTCHSDPQEVLMAAVWQAIPSCSSQRSSLLCGSRCRQAPQHRAEPAAALCPKPKLHATCHGLRWLLWHSDAFAIGSPGASSSLQWGCLFYFLSFFFLFFQTRKHFCRITSAGFSQWQENQAGCGAGQGG